MAKRVTPKCAYQFRSRVLDALNYNTQALINIHLNISTAQSHMSAYRKKDTRLRHNADSPPLCIFVLDVSLPPMLLESACAGATEPPASNVDKVTAATTLSPFIGTLSAVCEVIFLRKDPNRSALQHASATNSKSSFIE